MGYQVVGQSEISKLKFCKLAKKNTGKYLRSVSRPEIRDD